MTQEQLEDAIKVSRQTISLYERGKTAPPFDTLLSIARAVNATEFVVEDLHVTFSRNGSVAPKAAPLQLEFQFDKDGGATLRIEPSKDGILVKQMLA